MEAFNGCRGGENKQPLIPIPSPKFSIPLPQIPSDTSISFCLSSIFPNNSHVIQGFSPNTSSSISSDQNPCHFDQLASAGDHEEGGPRNNERRLKRMISNRESARRSRMRRKLQMDDLQGQVRHLQSSNHQLSEKLIQLLECNQQILQENLHLKERLSSLQIIVSDLLTPFTKCG